MSGRLEQLVLNLPHPLREAAANFKSWQLNRLRRGGDWAAYLAANRFQRYFVTSWEELRAEQDRRLAQLLERAIRQVPYYHAYPLVKRVDDLGQLPLLAKSQVRAAGTGLYDQVLIRDHHYTGHTSGSTGTPLVFKWTLDTLRTRFAMRDNFYAFYGCHPETEYNIRLGGRLFMPPAQNRPPFWITDRVSRQLMFSLYHMSEAALQSFLPVVNQVQPTFVTGYPSAVHTLAEFCLHEGSAFRPRAVFTDSETVLDYQRDTVRAAWGCEIHDYYGMEAGWLAGQCPQGQYHLSPLTSIVELLDEEDRPQVPGEVGEIVVTDLVNPLMPLIRYRTGDAGIWSSTPCGCGWQTPTLERIEGRMDDVVILPNGRKIGRLDHIFKAASNIRECQIIQETPSEFTFLVVPEEGYSDTIQQKLLAEAYARLGQDVTINIQQVAAIERTSRRKFRSVISKVSQQRDRQ